LRENSPVSTQQWIARSGSINSKEQPQWHRQ